MIIGRGRELTLLHDLAEAARHGLGGGLIVHGEPGIGKTALLDSMAADPHIRIVRACGYEGESHLPFGALHDLLEPLCDQLAAIPVPQAEAIRNALGLGRSALVDPVSTEVAAATLVQAAAALGPLAVLVDDMQWLDRESLRVVLHIARRASRLGLAFVGAVRDGDMTPAIAALPGIALGPLADEAAEQVVRTVTAARLVPAVVGSLVEAGGGNPLALRELVGRASTDELEGRSPLSDPLPVSAPVVLMYRRRIDELDGPSRLALLVAVAEGRGRLRPIVAALQMAGSDVDDLSPAERRGLVSLERDEVQFRHPLLRSVAYQLARPDERRLAHRLLAAVVEDDDRRAWHLGRSVVGPDRGVAEELIRMAERALERGADGTAARALERAGEATDDPSSQGRLYFKAARAANRSGDMRYATHLLERSRPMVGDGPAAQADLLLLDAELRMALGDHHGAFLQLSGRVDPIAMVDPRRALTMLLFAAKYHINRMEATEARATVERAEQLAGVAPSDSLRSASLAFVLTMTGDVEARPVALQAAEITMRSRRGHLHAESMGWPLVWLEEYELAERFLAWAAHQQREGGYHTFLPQTLMPVAELELRLGRWDRADRAAGEARRLFEETGQVAEVAVADGMIARLAAVRGDDVTCTQHATAAITADRASGLLAATAFAESALGHLAVSVGRYDEAVDRLERAAAIVIRGGVGEPWLLPVDADLTEALVHVQRLDAAAAVVGRLREQAAVVGRAPAIAAAARCAGLLSTADDWRQHFDDALAGHDLSPMPFERARTELAYGERLRRAGLRIEARQHLSIALTTFESLGARLWSARAAAELRASGVARRPASSSWTTLTERERQIALKVIDGATNKEVAIELFVTDKTVEFHLGNVYRKLGIRSRTELAHHLRRDAPA